MSQFLYFIPDVPAASPALLAELGIAAVLGCGCTQGAIESGPSGARGVLLGASEGPKPRLPYDGAAWYRLDYTPPELPADKRIYLAFGAVSEEAAVYVNGRQVYASRFGENIRHKRFLVDVTGMLQAARPCCLAVRVWNTGWCGGIWKNVKLVAEK